MAQGIPAQGLIATGLVEGSGPLLLANGTAAAPAYSFSGDLKIVVLQRGWVMVGRLERNGSECKLHNASVIRCWGTTKGLGEIAQEGPKSSTKLDKCGGTVEFDYLTVVCAITCKESVWASVL